MATRYRVMITLVGALALDAGLVVTIAQAMLVSPAHTADPYAVYIAEASRRFGVPERWVRAVLRAESSGDVRAFSSAGARGLMQVMPETWEGLRDRYRLGHDPYQPRDNILAGTAYLREMWDRYGNVVAMLAAYNAGPTRYDEYHATGKDLPAETRAYVAAIAPLIGDAVPPGLQKRVAPPPDWRDAPLFIVRSTDSGATVALPSSDVRAAVPVRGRNTPVPQNGSMFVARAGDRRTP